MKSFDELTQQAKHKAFVEALARETRQAIDYVAPIYDTVYADLQRTAHIRDFVPVFAWRRARELLRHP